MKQFFRYVLGTLFSPRRTFITLLTDSHRLYHGTGAALLLGILYTIIVYFGYLNGFGAVVEPWIPLSGTAAKLHL